MAKQIIILDRVAGGPDGPGWTVALWADVPVAKQPFWAGRQPASAWAGAGAAENLSIQTGAVRERTLFFVPPSAWTLAEIKARLVDLQADWQADVTADSTFGRYGTFYDGASWTAGGA